jgi:cytochrome c553
MGSACHASTQTSRAFAFGGTVYQTGGSTAAANVQIAITSGTTTVTTYSATNGNFWLPLASAPSINWTTATVHLRNAKGEVAKASGTSVAAGCNSCHGSTMRIIGP